MHNIHETLDLLTNNGVSNGRLRLDLRRCEPLLRLCQPAVQRLRVCAAPALPIGALLQQLRDMPLGFRYLLKCHSCIIEPVKEASLFIDCVWHDEVSSCQSATLSFIHQQLFAALLASSSSCWIRAAAAAGPSCRPCDFLPSTSAVWLLKPWWRRLSCHGAASVAAAAGAASWPPQLRRRCSGMCGCCSRISRSWITSVCASLSACMGFPRNVLSVHVRCCHHLMAYWTCCNAEGRLHNVTSPGMCHLNDLLHISAIYTS